MGGWMEGWIVAHFTEETRIKAWGQWSDEEEEDQGRGKWEDVSAAIEFDAGHNGDGGGGAPVEGRDSQRECVYEIESEDFVIVGGRSTFFEISQMVRNVNVKLNSCFTLSCELVGRLPILKRWKLSTPHMPGR